MSPVLRRLGVSTMLTFLTALCLVADPIKVLIVDGRNNHDWVRTTESCKATLEATGAFKVDVSTAPAGFTKAQPHKPKPNDEEGKKAYDEAMKVWRQEEAAFNKEHAADWQNWVPKFANYQVVINNYNGQEWSEPMKEAFTEYVLKGGGVVNVHAANNSFANWDDFNEMICIGWRGATFQDRVAVDDATGKAIVVSADDEKIKTKGFGSGHGARHPFLIKTRDNSHPILKDLPTEWLHASDELYHRMRGSANHIDVIASAFSEEKFGGTDMHEPMIWWANFGEGRVVTTSMGHLWAGDKEFIALHCVGFQTILARSAEWAATGKVTIPVPAEFPTKDKESIVEPSKVTWKR